MSLRIRRGGNVLPTGGGGIVFGPTEGAQVIRDSTGPRTVATPGGGISFNSSSSLQTAIDANAAGTVFVCTVNAPTWNAIVNCAAKAPKIYFPGPVGQKQINGHGLGTAAINCGTGATEIHGGTWSHFGIDDAGNLTGSGPNVHGIQGGDPTFGSNGVIVEDFIVEQNKAVGLAMGAGTTNFRASHFIARQNGIAGFTGATGPNVTIEYGETWGNNTQGQNPGIDGGSCKILNCSNGWFHHLWAHDEIGFGLWWDTNNADCTIEENVSENNQRAGFFYEASSGSLIQHNYVANNGRNVVIGGQNPSFENCVQMRVADSNCENGSSTRGLVRYNDTDYTLTPPGANFGGIFLLWNHTGTTSRSVRDWDVSQNRFWLRGSNTARIGGEDTAASAIDVWDEDNHFYGNEYHVASMATNFWKWDVTNGAGIAKTWAQWQAFGHDLAGTRVLI